MKILVKIFITFSKTIFTVNDISVCGFQIVVALLMIAAGDISSLIDFLGFVTWLFYGLNFLAVVILRFRMKDASRPYRVIIA